MKVAIVGRINVGKSTLFNRLIEEKKSLVSTLPSTTRDRIFGQCLWRGEKFELIDVGGINAKKQPPEILEKEIQKQIDIALKESDLILFLLDGKIGVTSDDREIAKKLKKLKKSTILVVNKIDSLRERQAVEKENFLKLGLGQPILISAVNGSGLGDLLDEIIKKLKKNKSQKKDTLFSNDYKWKRAEMATKIAIIGKTNVGKSTLINSLLGEERIIVSPLPHTTREPIDTYLNYKGSPLILIDTAGIRKRTKIKLEIEKIGLIKSLKMIERADIIWLILNPLEPVSHLERTLTGIIKKNAKGLVLVVNKLDLIKTKVKEYIDYYQKEFSNLWWAPIVFISAKEKINLEKLLDLTLEIKIKMQESLSSKRLNESLKRTIQEYKFKEKYWSKTKIFREEKTTPILIIKIPNLTRKEKPPVPAQINLLEKRIREEFELWGVPLIIKIKN